MNRLQTRHFMSACSAGTRAPSGQALGDRATRLVGSVALLIPLLAWTQPGVVRATEIVDLGVDGIAIEILDGWSFARHANFHRIYDVPLEEQTTIDHESLKEMVQISVFAEPQADHAAALQRLREIASESEEPGSFVEIAGWPALRRQRMGVRPQPGTLESSEAEQVLKITTAVAVDDVLVRLEAWLPPEASQEVVTVVDAIGASLTATAVADPLQVQQDIADLQANPTEGLPLMPPPDGGSDPSAGEAIDPISRDFTASAPAVPAAGSTVRVTNQGGFDSELEIAVADGGQDILIGSNNGFFFSSDGGGTWNASLNIGSNDPSTTWGQSGGPQGTFYAANIADLFAPFGAGNSDSTGFWTSIDGGATFNGPTVAYTCGQGGDPPCSFPDQEHIAADRFNVTAGGDQVYSTWRHLDGNWGIVCSNDSGATWSTTGFFAGGDLPKIAVGQDGAAYVVYHPDDDDNIRLSKFTSCEANQNPMVRVFDAPVVANPTSVACPTPGLDRCNLRNSLASPTVAVDDLDSSHIYVAYASNTVNTSPAPGGPGAWWPGCNNQNICNENVVVQDSLDGGLTWAPGDSTRTLTISSGVVARRFMPWACAVGGEVFVSWYDRQAASPGGTTVSNNSLTDFFRGSAFLNDVGNLTRGPEMQVNEAGSTDAQCEAGAVTGSSASWVVPGFIAAVDRPGDSQSCSLQPQLGGMCCVPGEISASGRCTRNVSTGQPCDFDATVCPVGETCASARGWPKYGDYNGSACAEGRFYATWASATSPASIIPASTGIDMFFVSDLVCCVPQIQGPDSVSLPDACPGTSSSETLHLCNTGKEDLVIGPITSSDAQFVIVPLLSGFPVVLSPDFCFPFQVDFTPTGVGPQESDLTIPSNDPVNPTVTMTARGNALAPGDVRVTGSSDFGSVCAEELAEKPVSVCNVGACNLAVTSVSVDCSDFTLINNPFPAPVSPDSCQDVVVRFTPTSAGPKVCNLTIMTDDPDQPVIVLVLTGNTPLPAIDVPPDQGFPATVIQSAGACLSQRPFPVSNTGQCNLAITNLSISTNPDEFGLSGLPSFPIILQAGHVAGSGGLRTVFEPDVLDRDRLGEVSVTYVDDPILGTTTTVMRDLCGEGATTGVRVLATNNGVPIPTGDVFRIQLQRVTGNRKRRGLISIDNLKDPPLQQIVPALPCVPIQFHGEFGTVDNPVQLLPGFYNLRVTARVDGKRRRKSAGFDLLTCDFNRNVVIDF